jgi:general secretion pathway protein B
MSFILDALKKSENDRQQRGTAEFANVPSSSGRRERPPVWLWVVAVLLLVNLVVLIGIMLRPDVSVSEPVARQVTEATALEVDEARARVIDNFADQVASARENAPAREDPVKPAANTSPPAESMPAVTNARQPVSTATLPTIYQLQASGELLLPELHVDIHVFSEVAKDRFVFINMTKLKEGSQLAEGPLVEEITSDGVVLSHNGTRFLLPRD